MPVPVLARLTKLVCLSLALVLLARCAPAPPSSPTSTPEAGDTGPPLVLLYADSSGLQMQDAATETVSTLAPDAEYTGARALSPSGRYLAVSYASDSSRLGLIDLQSQTLQVVHQHPDAVTYSVAWHATNDTLAFGFFVPTDDGGRGTGGIRRVAPGRTSTDVGCTAAREVLHWLPTGALATRNDERLYLVDATDCATVSSLDVRKKHTLTYAADGSHLAYILRELDYDRSAGAYVADSALYVSAPDGDDAELLFGDARAVRRLAWSPTGAKLAFDLRAEETSRRRAVVHDASQARTSYVIPSRTGSADETHPRWSPDGTRVAFLLRRETGQQAAVRVAGQTQQLGEATGPIAGWAGSRHVVVPGPDSLRVKTLRGETVYAVPASVTYLHAVMQPRNGGA